MGMRKTTVRSVSEKTLTRKSGNSLYKAGDVAQMIQWIYKQRKTLDADTYMDEDTKGVKIIDAYRKNNADMG